MTDIGIVTAERQALEAVCLCGGEAARAEAIREDFVNHEVPAESL